MGLAALHVPLAQMSAEVILPAASVIMLRGTGKDAQVLMGQRSADAAFMPKKFVFPGGRVDPGDHDAALPDLLAATCAAALAARPLPDEYGLPPSPIALAASALRELHEETGLTLARPRQGALRFIFRAITPQGRTRRFDARFFQAHIDDFVGDAAGFSRASGELTSLQWLSIAAASRLDIPFITKVILAQIAEMIKFGDTAPALQGGVPFFDNAGQNPAFTRL